jgi:DNA-binding GntR family transcriptional regulator
MYDADSRLRVHDDHKRILAAVRAGDTEELINNMDAHRGATERLIVQRLGPARGR